MITALGGVGKTQLALSFCEAAEKGGYVPGGIFCVVADGAPENDVSALADLAEFLLGSKMETKERNQANNVTSVLQMEFRKRNGRWLLCIDNVDEIEDPEVRSIVNEGFAFENHENGWVLVTTRVNKDTLCSGMKKEQKIVLSTLSISEGKLALWRIIHSVDFDTYDDDTVLIQIDEWRKENKKGYEALRKLTSKVLGGLALAIEQSGSYIRDTEVSISEYLDLYQNVDSMVEMEKLLPELPGTLNQKPETKTALRTWKISFDRLS